MSNDRRAIIGMIIYIVSACIIALIFCGCTTTRYIPVETVRDVYHNTTDTIRDSISHTVYVYQYSKGDTIFKERVESLYVDRWRVRDSITVERDSIPYPVQVTEYVEKDFSLWQYILIGSAFLIVVYNLSKLIAKFKKWDGW